MPYDTLRDLAPIMLIAKSASCLCAHPSLPVKGVKDFVALAKAQPGRINYATPGVGTVGHFAIELFATQRGHQDEPRAVQGRGAVHRRPDRRPHRDRAQIQFAQLGAAREAGQAALPRRDLERRARRCCPTCRRSPSRASRASRATTGTACSRPPRRPRPIIARIHEVLAKALKTPEARELYVGQGHELGGDGPGRVRGIHPRRNREMGEGGEGGGHTEAVDEVT